MNLTVRRSGEDISIESLRLVPFAGLPEVDVAPAEFREHVLRVTRGTIKRWDLDKINGVFIAASTARGRFTQREIQQMRELFGAEDAVPAFTRGRIIPVHDEGSLAAIPYHYADGRFDPAPGWIVVAPDSTSSVSSWSDATERNSSGVYDRGVIVVNPPRAARLGDAGRLVTYEAGRVLGMIGNSNPIFFEHTMMVAGAGPQVSDRPTAVDRKTAAILYEDSFPVGLDLELLLGLEFDATAAVQNADGK